jgi:hypothetical protein
MPWWKHLYRSIRWGDWDIGWETRKTWKDKPYLDLCATYYDGYHWCIHLGPFYVGAAYY